ncbi:helix-turn-helix domain-containing protein [Paenibacillus methanolicus]|uniref:AraC-like DNA-binding protein n=1 Tax=Paenibacillus methanolicus TaxID=582686 RepID=A0A5S5CH30_9BACL|nr:helix-turn-helix domain-containing protein [Paenibacillus methanolicus]TYP79099.1 AraC-like DNA-binding protein [Paenibacillus methanolicus]
MSNQSSIFRSFLISYIIILIIPSLAGYMSYRTSIAVTQSVSIENSLTLLQKSQQMLERRMAEVEGFTRQLALNQDLYVLMNEKTDPGEGNVYGIWKIMKEVMVYGQTNDFLQNYYIYLRNANVVLTPGSAYFRPEHYYEKSHYRDMSLQEWQSSILGRTHSREILPLTPYVGGGAETAVLTFAQSLPLDSFGDEAPATVVVLIDQKTIGELLAGVKERYGGWTYVSDAEGRAISALGTDERAMTAMNGDANFRPNKQNQWYGDDLVITMRSDTTGWVYQAGIPRAALMQNANRIKYISWSVTGAALVVGLVVGWMLSRRNSAPINRLLGLMREQSGKPEPAGQNAYDFLQGNIASMLTNNRWLETELGRQQPLIRDAFLKRLLAGDFQTREELQAAADQANMGMAPDRGYVGILRIRGYAGVKTVEILNELSAARLLLKQQLLEAGMPLHMTDSGADGVVLIAEADGAEEGRAKLDSVLAELADALFHDYKMTIGGAFGDFFATETEVSRAFEQAKEALAFADYAQRKGFCWHDEMSKESTAYYYPLETELRLIGALRAGEEGEALRILEAVIAHNADNRKLSPEMAIQLVVELRGTLLKLLDHKAFADSPMFETARERILALQLQGSLAQVEAEAADLMRMLGAIVAGKKQDMHNKTVEGIKQFIASHYSDADLTLYRIAEQAERPEKSVSSLFKEVTGTNLSDYLEQVRIDRAAAMLKETAATVDDIALQVGYNSSHSFRRAFKRVLGVSPSLYRQSLE